MFWSPRRCLPRRNRIVSPPLCVQSHHHNHDINETRSRTKGNAQPRQEGQADAPPAYSSSRDANQKSAIPQETKPNCPKTATPPVKPTMSGDSSVAKEQVMEGKAEAPQESKPEVTTATSPAKPTMFVCIFCKQPFVKQDSNKVVGRCRFYHPGKSQYCIARPLRCQTTNRLGPAFNRVGEAKGGCNCRAPWRVYRC